MAELKPCPFCGRVPRIGDCGYWGYFIICECGIEQSELYKQKCDAVKHWNRRKTEPSGYNLSPVDKDINVRSKDEPMKTTDYCDICKRDMCEFCTADNTNPYCVPSHYEIKQDEPQAERSE